MSRSQQNTVRDWRKGYGVVDPTDKEVISYSLWSRKTFTSASTTSLTFFDASQSGMDGNLPLSGQLANGTAFLIEAIRFVPAVKPTEAATAATADGAADGALNDVFQIITTGSALLRVGDKEYGRWPLFMLPAAAGLYGGFGNVGTNAAGSASQFSFASNGVPDPRSSFTLPIPIVIPPQYTFSLQVVWEAAITTHAATGNPKVFAIFDGELMRPKQ